MTKIETSLVILIALISFMSCSISDKRKRLVILETGVNVTSEIAPFLCKDGHESFLSNSRWNEDKIGHGTSVTKVIAQRLNPKESCIVVYKTADHGVESKIRAEAYATALVNLASQEFKVLLISLEDSSYFFKEIEFFNTLLEDKTGHLHHIVVAAGNGSVQLSESNQCHVFPACLRNKLSTEESKSRFYVVGSTDGKFNQGKIITARRPSNFGNRTGTSFSAARFASELMD